MAKLSLASFGSLFSSWQALNSNNTAIVAAMENTLSRDGTAPNQMQAVLDMNSNRIINLPSPVNSTEPLRLGDLSTIGFVYSNTSFISTTALLAAFPAPQVLGNGITAQTGCRAVIGDKGGALFRYDNTDVTTADNGGNVRVDAVGRRWKAIIPGYMPVALFGALASASDNTTAINAAFVAAAALNISIALQGLSLVCLGALTWDQAHTGIEGQGGFLDFSGSTVPATLIQFSTWTDANTMSMQHNIHPIRNFRMKGHVAGVPPFQVAFQPIPSILGGIPWFTGCVYEDIGSTQYSIFYDIPDGCVAPIFRNIHSGVDANHWFLRNSGSTNSGENIFLDRCFIVNCSGFYIDKSNNPNVDILCVGCSFDGLNTLVGGGDVITGPNIVRGSEGNFKFIACHWEPNSPAAFKFGWVADAGSITAIGVNYVIQNPPSVSPFQSDATIINKGIILRDCDFYANNQWPNGLICTGNGNFECNAGANGNSFIMNGSFASNRIADYGFVNALGNWTGAPTRDTVNKPAGATASATCVANTLHSFTTPCRPGQHISVSAYLKFTTPTGGDTFNMVAAYIDKGGNILSSTEVDNTTAINSFTQEILVDQVLAPPGTERAIITFAYLTGGATATAKFALPMITIQ